MLTLTSNHFNEILRYPVQGKDWFVRIGLQGAVLMMLCPFLIGIPLLNGFMVAHTQRGIAGSGEYPSWSHWGVYWTLGWKALAANMLYYLPILALLVIYLIVIFVPILIGLAIDEPDVGAVGGIIGTLGMFIVYPLLFVYLILYIAIQMATGAKIAAGGSIHQAINWKQYIWPYIKANAVSMLLVYLIGYLASVVAMVGIFAFVLGIFLTMPFALVLMAYAHGVIYRLSTVK